LGHFLFAEYLRQAPGAAMIHLACHGDFRAEDPNYSSLHLAEGWVTAGDVARQKLNAELVTLSACDTGINKVAAGEEVLGMARGFLSAGVRNVILSHWAVNDADAPRLMQDLYTEIQLGTDVAASLRKAQINAIRRGANPYIWAPYFLIGAG
jgi:CHAT domain-containing protein